MIAPTPLSAQSQFIPRSFRRLVCPRLPGSLWEARGRTVLIQPLCLAPLRAGHTSKVSLLPRRSLFSTGRFLYGLKFFQSCSAMPTPRANVQMSQPIANSPTTVVAGLFLACSFRDRAKKAKVAKSKTKNSAAGCQIGMKTTVRPSSVPKMKMALRGRYHLG